MNEEKKSRVARRNIYIICSLWAIVSGLWAFKHNSLLQLISFFLILGMLVTLASSIAYFRFWKVERLKIFLPIIVWSVSTFVPGTIGNQLRELYLRSKIDDLEKEIAIYRSSGIYPLSDWKSYGEISPFIHENGDTVITYWWGDGFPVKHSALIFCTATDSTMFKGGLVALKDRGWHRGRMLQKNWYIATD